MNFIFPFSWEWNNIPTDFHSIIFQRGRYGPHQPDLVLLEGQVGHRQPGLRSAEGLSAQLRRRGRGGQCGRGGPGFMVGEWWFEWFNGNFRILKWRYCTI